MPLMRSRVASANAPETDFPLNNLALGVFSAEGGEPHCGVAIGAMILDATAAEEAGLIDLGDGSLLDVPFWNELMEAGPEVWADFRAQVTALLGEAGDPAVEAFLHPMAGAVLHLPFLVSEFTDFYSGRNHAETVSLIMRGANALPPNWMHLPIGYNGRASSVVVGGTPVRRPVGQLMPPGADAPYFGPSKRFDFELELGAIVGTPSTGPVSVAEAAGMIFGYVLLNDWSARDIQAWEYQPLGPFQSKATATTISPWIVMAAALAPFRAPGQPREFPPLPYLRETQPGHLDLSLSVALIPEGGAEAVIARTSARELTWSAAQQLCHHTTSGCPMNAGDLLGSGTISGNSPDSRGCLLEATMGGKAPLTLPDGTTRSFLADGDTVILRGHAQGDGYRIGFGDCAGRILPAVMPDWASA